jgi:hypothetical protein
MKIEVRLKESGRMIGWKDYETKTYSKNVSYKKHWYKSMNAWGIDCKLHESILPDNWTIEITDMDNGIVYKTDAKTYKDKGHYFHYKRNKVDYGAQIFLTLPEFDIATQQTQMI